MAQIIMPTRDPAPQREEKKESALDKLLKGLQVAGSAFGIASDVSSISARSQASDIAEAREARDQAKFGIETQRTTMEAPKGAPGTEITLQTPEGEDVRSLRVPRPKEPDKMLAGKQRLQELAIKKAQKNLARDQDKNSKAFTMTPDQIASWKSRGVPDVVLDMVQAGHGGRNPTTTLNNAAEKDELNRAEVDAINGFDESELILSQVIETAKPEFIGAIDGRIHKSLISPANAEFRAKMGRMNAAYRKAITGLTASEQEREELMELLPTETDTFGNFIAKAKGLDVELDQKRRLLLGNYEKSGKFVDTFREQGSTFDSPALANKPVSVQTSTGKILVDEQKKNEAIEILKQRKAAAQQQQAPIPGS